MSVFKMVAHYILLGSALLCSSLHFHAHVLSPQTRTRLKLFLYENKSTLGRVTPLRRARSVTQEQLECCFQEFFIKMA